MYKVSVDDLNDRGFLNSLQVAARKKSDQVVNANWEAAYDSLAKAADHCDALNARCANHSG